MCKQDTVGMLVFGSNFVVGNTVGEALTEMNHFIVPRNILHGQRTGLGLTTVCHTLSKT